MRFLHGGSGRGVLARAVTRAVRHTNTNRWNRSLIVGDVVWCCNYIFFVLMSQQKQIFVSKTYKTWKTKNEKIKKLNILQLFVISHQIIVCLVLTGDWGAVCTFNCRSAAWAAQALSGNWFCGINHGINIKWFSSDSSNNWLIVCQ